MNFWQTCIRDATPPFCVCAMLAGEMPMLPEEVASRVQQEAQMLMASVHGAMLSARAFDDPGLFVAIVKPQIAKLLVPDR